MAMESRKLHVVMFPFFAFGHVSPFMQLSNKLSSHGVRISFFTIPGFIPKLETLINATQSIQIIPLQLEPSLGLPPDLAGTSELSLSEAAKLVTAMDLTRPQVETLLSELKPDFVMFDFAQHWLPSLASRLGIKSLSFSVFSAIAMAYLVVPGRLIGVEGNPTAHDLTKPPQGFPLLSHDQDNIMDGNLPFLKPFEAQTCLFLYESYKDGSLSNFDRIKEGLAGSSAIIVKTCYEMEGPYLHYLRTQLNKPYILTGPIVPEPDLRGVIDERWANWLAQFPNSSVVFCSFGSETFLSREKIRELALGLELTGLPFVMVLNFPKSVDSEAELECSLPLGFLERTKEKGLVHVGWVPQQFILNHANVGCYLCHAGFGSLVEALASDCQLVLLPQKTDQYFNSRLVGDKGYMRAGVEVNTRDEDGHFGKEDICAAVRTIMVDVDQEPGKSIRLSQKKWHNFLVDNEVQEKFISDMVVEMKRIIIDDSY